MALGNPRDTLGYPNLGPKLLGIKAHDDIDLAQQPSKGPPSLPRSHPARGKRLPSIGVSVSATPTLERVVSVSLEAQRPRGQPRPSSGWFPSRSRLSALEGNPDPRAGGFRLARGSAPSRATPTLERVVSLELATQARAGLAGNNAQRSATHQRHHDAVKKQGSLLHAITYSRRGHRSNPLATATSKEATEARIGPRTQDTTFDAVNCHEKEGRYVSPCHVVSGVGRRDSRSRTVRGMDEHLGLRSLSPSPTLLVNPYYKQHVTRCIASLLDVRPRGRNQDKTSTAITRRCRCDQIRHRHAALLSFPMTNFGEGRPPLGESNLLPAGQEIRFGSLRFQTCGDDYHMRILQKDPSNQPEPHHQPPATPRRRSRPGPRARRTRAARRAADIGDPHPTREGGILWSGSQERAAPILPGPMAAPRATTAHSYPYGLRTSVDAYASFIRTAMSANGNQPGCHPVSKQYFADPLPGDSRTESDDGHAFMRRHPGWDYSGLRDPEAFIAFQTAADYCFEYSDDEYDPTRECFVINDGQASKGSTSDDDGGGDDQGNDDGMDPIGAQPSDPSDHSPSEDERDPRHLPRVSGDVSPPARSDREPGKRGDEHATNPRHAGRVAQARILAEGKDDELAPRTGQKLIAAAALLRAMPEAATPEGRKLHLEARKLVEHAARQQAESSASRLRRPSASKGERGEEPSVRSPRPNGRARAQSCGDSCRDSAQRHANEPRTPEARTLPTRVPARSRLRDTRGAVGDGDARNTLNHIRQREGARAHQRGRTDVRWNRDAVSEPAGTRVFSRNIRTAPIPPRFRQPTTITKYSGETDPRVWLNDYRLACQLGGATDEAMIIRNLPLHLADSARTWLEHLPPNRIRDWDDLVETFVGNFQGTYVRPGNTWDLRGCRQKPGESLRDFIRRFSKRCTELPNITDHQIIHFFLESTTSYNLICKLGRDPPPDANRLFEVASKYASGEEAANAIFNGKKGKRPEETPAEGSRPRKPSRNGPQPQGAWRRDDPPPTEILANACDIQQLRQGRLSRVLAYASRLRQHLTSLRLSHSRTIDPSGYFLSRRMHSTRLLFRNPRREDTRLLAYASRLRQHLTSLRLMATSFRGACIRHDVHRRDAFRVRFNHQGHPSRRHLRPGKDALPPSGQLCGHFAHATPEKARALPHEVAVTALTVIMTPHQEVEGTFNTPTLERAAFILLIRGSNLGPSKGFDKGSRSTESGIIDGTLEARALEEANRLCSRPGKVPRSRDPTRGSIEPSTSIERGRVPSSILLRKAFTGVSYDHEPTLIERGMDVRSNYPLSAHPGIHGSIPIVGSMDRPLLSPSKGIPRNEEKFGTSRAKRGSGAPSAVDKPTRPCSSPHRPHRAERNMRRERSRLPPRREEVIVLLIRGSNLGPSKGFDKGPRSTESGIINGTLEARTLEETNRLCSRPGKVPRSRDPSGGASSPRPLSNEPTLIERGMDVHSNHPLPAQPGIRGSIPPREARVASSSAPSNREREARRKLEIPPTSGAVDEPTPEEAVNALHIRLRPWESLGGYTRGCASAPPRILGTHEETKASKASTNSSLRGIKLHPCEGSGATVGYLQKGYPNLGPKLLGIKAHDDIDLAQQPSKGPPSLPRSHPARGKRLPSIGVSVSFEAQRPRGRPRPSSGWFPSRSRLSALEGNPDPRAGGFRLARGSAPSRATPTLERVVSLELATQARAGLAGNNAQRSATHQRHHDAVKKQGSLLHAITYSRRGHRSNPLATATSKEATEARIGPRTQDTTFDAVNCHEKEGRYVSPCHVVSGVGRRDSRSRTVRGMDEHLGLRSLSPSPTLLVNPYYKQHVTRCIAPLLDVRPRGRNQDKTSSLTLAIGKTSAGATTTRQSRQQHKQRCSLAAAETPDPWQPWRRTANYQPSSWDYDALLSLEWRS
ncbi:hypothetical protein HU200_022678 [Digitaria exilis]|uniref:Retrotransposon gag domain-containing protein n=1 Tax=Digitaria exilis TaxID=1010633 RepID=A0A835C124_9POAL|nr:hypothetical protein HU200_022678 [Digitaria exilis]